MHYQRFISDRKAPRPPVQVRVSLHESVGRRVQHMAVEALLLGGRDSLPHASFGANPGNSKGLREAEQSLAPFGPRLVQRYPRQHSQLEGTTPQARRLAAPDHQDPLEDLACSFRSDQVYMLRYP